ncbi:MAG: aspartate aminotransferase family protein [Anaerolineae bacterium]
MSKSRELYERALSVMPGGNSRLTVFSHPHPTYAAYGTGCTLVDVDGRSYLDFINNYTVLVHGHAHPAIVAAITGRLAKGSAFSLPTEAEVELATLLTRRLPAVEHIRFTNSGTEAVMMAIKAARAYTGRPRIAKFEGAYHGTYDGAEVSQNSRPEEWGPVESPRSIPLAAGTPPGILADVVVLPFQNRAICQQLIERHARELAAILVDPVPHRMGLIPAPPAFLSFLREISRAYDILLISDEVLSLRIGYHGAHGTLGFQPDLITAGKIVGGGLPVGAVGGSAAVMSVFDPRQARVPVPHGGTFNGNPLTMAAGSTAMEMLTEDAVARLNNLGQQLRMKANAIFASQGVPGQVTGAGSLFLLHPHDRPLTDYRSAVPTTEENRRRERVCHYLQKHGILISPTGLGCLSTPMTEVEVEAFTGVLEAAVKAEASLAG